MDVRRYQQARSQQTDNMSLSTSTFPGLITLAVGLLIVVVGTILLAAFGVPTGNVAENPKQISGVVVISIGGIVSLTGVGVSAYLKKKKDEAKRARKRIELQQKQQGGGHRPSGPPPPQNNHHQQQQFQHQELRVPPEDYNNSRRGTGPNQQQHRHQQHQYNQHQQHPSAPVPGNLYGGGGGNSQYYNNGRGKTTSGGVATVYS